MSKDNDKFLWSPLFWLTMFILTILLLALNDTSKWYQECLK